MNLHLPYPNFSGVLSTGGGLVFVGLMDGTVAALDDTSLDELGKVSIGSAFSAPPMTFEVNGKQYVAIASGTAPASGKRRRAMRRNSTSNADYKAKMLRRLYRLTRVARWGFTQAKRASTGGRGNLCITSKFQATSNK